MYDHTNLMGVSVTWLEVPVCQRPKEVAIILDRGSIR